ncbi:hypothetical protein [Streptomyces viridochromogenes]|uniref:hypothetical protein n=1 Tax=Streptomyces viridochromogenes TaxID=1938 RepID=UPI00069EEE14|nr:hypothetical protein [Streptomyces viridochromogenes]KOG11403.1 hypothetical protein ADK36_36825 [Streptomyces viridochromogenes]KOG11955.1 hypothetical protein ADK35_35180 [Streptomyces viridochromogenes]
MGTQTANGDSRPSGSSGASGSSGPAGPSFWPRVREFAVPASMIETATARRLAGDWAGACAAAGVDVDLQLRSVVRDYGRELAARVRDDLRHLAPDLLRWHMPRIAPDGLLRPGLTLALAKYGGGGRDGGGAVYLVVRTAPAWADAGQRISLALWDGGRSSRGPYPDPPPHPPPHPSPSPHPHPRPSRRFRFDLHRHLWDARRAGELRMRAGVGLGSDLMGAESPYGPGCAVDRWADEARMLLRAEGRSVGDVLVRLRGRHRLVLQGIGDEGGGGDTGGLRIVAAAAKGRTSALPVLPDAATWVLPDLELLRAGAIEAERLHPLVASALVPETDSSSPRASRTPPASGPVERVGQPRPVDCRGARHRIGLVDGVLAPLDHDPAEIQREELLAALTGTPLPCLQAIDEAHRHPECLPDVRERLDHGDIAGALAVVEGLLGPAAVLRDGALRDELEAAARQRITYGLFRAGLIGPGPGRVRYDERDRPRSRPRSRRAHARHAQRP